MPTNLSYIFLAKLLVLLLLSLLLKNYCYHCFRYYCCCYYHQNYHITILLNTLLQIINLVGILGTRVPRLACLRPAAWLKEWPSAAHLCRHKLKNLARGQALRGGRQEASSGATSSGRLARRRRDQGRGTSRGTRDASLDD